MEELCLCGGVSAGMPKKNSSIYDMSVEKQCRRISITVNTDKRGCEGEGQATAGCGGSSGRVMCTRGNEESSLEGETKRLGERRGGEWAHFI
jgi:hypothetical protein